MPWVTPELNGEFFNITGNGPLAQSSIVQDSIPPTSILNAGNWTSGAIVSNGYKVIGVGVTSSGAGALQIQRYLDRECTVPAAAVSNTALVAATPLVVVINGTTDGIPFAGFTMTITNTSGGTVAITKFYCLLQAF